MWLSWTIISYQYNCLGHLLPKWPKQIFFTNMSNLTFTNVSKVGLSKKNYQYVCAPRNSLIWQPFHSFKKYFAYWPICVGLDENELLMSKVTQKDHFELLILAGFFFWGGEHKNYSANTIIAVCFFSPWLQKSVVAEKWSEKEANCVNQRNFLPTE